jgi:hypothetical protein
MEAVLINADFMMYAAAFGDDNVVAKDAVADGRRGGNVDMLHSDTVPNFGLTANRTAGP